MRSYTVHRRRTIGDPLKEAEETVFVREGFAWLALIVSAIWALYHRLWLVLIGYVSVVVGLNVGLDAVDAPGQVTFFANLAVNGLFAAEANDLRRWTLSRRGYDLVAVVLAPTFDEAEVRYFRGWHPAMAAAGSDRGTSGEATAVADGAGEVPPGGLVPGDRPA